MYAHIVGSHHVGSGDNRRYVQDFNFRIELSEYVANGWQLIKTQPIKTEGVIAITIEQALNEYCSSKRLRDIYLMKEPHWNLENLKNRVRELVSEVW